MHQSFDHDQPSHGAPQRNIPRRGFVRELEFIAYRVCTFSLFPRLLRQGPTPAHAPREHPPGSRPETTQRTAA